MSTNNKIKLPEGITPEMVEAAVSNPGAVVSKGDLESASAGAPRQSVPISGYGSEIRPRIANNDPSEGLIAGPSKSFGSHLAKQAQEYAKAEAERLREADESKKALSPQALRRDVEALRRELKRIKKQLKEHIHEDSYAFIC